jgi:hypothetical protein
VEQTTFCPPFIPKSAPFLSLTVRARRDTTGPRLQSTGTTGPSRPLLCAFACFSCFPPLPFVYNARWMTKKKNEKKKITEVAASSSHPRHHPAPTGPLTRSAMAARPAGAAGPPAAAGQHGSETSPAATPLSSSGPPAPPPQESSHEPHRRSITRKRAASINTEEANRPKIESLSLATPSTASPRPFDTSGGLVCLCTPAPKVPRPRNGMSFPVIGSGKPSYTHLPAPCDLSDLSPLSLM